VSGGVIIPDKETAKALNDLARHKAIVRILNDIRMDMEICEIEGWDKNEYLNLIRQLLNSIGGRSMNDLIDRAEAIRIASGYCHPANIAEELRKLPAAVPERDKSKRVLWTGWKGYRYTRYRCPSCKKTVKNDDVYCHKCGQKLMFPQISWTPYVEGQEQELIVRWDDE